MKFVIWTDKEGYKHGSLMRDGDDENHPEVGIPVDPPPLKDLIVECTKELHNELVVRNLFTWDDVAESQNGLTTAILSVFRRKIIEHYRAIDRQTKE